MAGGGGGHAADRRAAGRVAEERLAEANRLAAESGSRADLTGSAGLAGLLDLRSTGVIGPDQRVAVLFTGRAPDQVPSLIGPATT